VGYSVDTKLKDLLADAKAAEILRRHFPERRGDPQVQQVMYYSLREIAMYPEAGISPAKLKAVDEELKAL
jgi:hypothetical protein